MSFGSAVGTCLRKYADFSGRAQRPEYWWFWLFNLLVVGVPSALGAILVVSGASGSTGSDVSPAFYAGLALIAIAGIVAIALLIPNYAVGCRRLHDKGISGWLQLITLIPVGGIVLLVLFLLRGDAADNAYGPSPTA